jgi:hypothetical protein
MLTLRVPPHSIKLERLWEGKASRPMMSKIEAEGKSDFFGILVLVEPSTYDW